jgi:TRAP-type C4-dicarboxylate transport system permease small subunit
MFCVCFLLLLQTGTRLMSSSAFGWAEEAARYLFIWAVMLGAGFAVRHGAHILADVLRPKSSHVLAVAWLVLLEGLVAAASLALFVYGIQLTIISSNSMMVGLPFSMGYRNAAVPAGAALMLAFSLAKIVEMLRGMRRPASPAADAPPPDLT